MPTSRFPERLKWWAVALGAGLAVFAAGFIAGSARPARLAGITQAIHDLRAPPRFPSSPFAYLPGEAGVVMLGDSITAATQWSELLPGVPVINRGVAEDTVLDVAERLDEVLRRRPRKIFLLAGINDLRGGRPAETILRDYDRIVRRSRAAGAEVYVQSILLVGPGAGAPELNFRILALNAGLRDLCAVTGARYVDLLPRLCPDGALDPRFTPDGLHLNGAAYLAWAEELRPLAR